MLVDWASIITNVRNHEADKIYIQITIINAYISLRAIKGFVTTLICYFPKNVSLKESNIPVATLYPVLKFNVYGSILYIFKDEEMEKSRTHITLCLLL